ncbi:ribosomal RNA small subunit methyltransferase A [bacterium]|nr:ribosomal RNA small subunit methyltransferase A [bacterium]
MSLIQEVKSLCQKYNFKPLRRRGQNFLINKKIIFDIIKSADLLKNDIVLEIGAGIGTITKEIAKKVEKVIAVEIDKKLVEILKKQLENFKNVKIIQENILEMSISQLEIKNYKIVTNLPYNITGAVLKKFLSAKQKPKLMVLILQKEVAQRICAQPPKMNLLAVSVQFYSQPKIIRYVLRSNFWPRPKVDSAILKITPITTNKKNIDEYKFFKVVRAGFSSPRKYLLNNLIKGGIINNKESGQKIFKKLKLNSKIRAENLKIEDWQKLVKFYEKK